jgi:hypothetical protein
MNEIEVNKIAQAGKWILMRLYPGGQFSLPSLVAEGAERGHSTEETVGLLADLVTAGLISFHAPEGGDA